MSWCYNDHIHHTLWQPQTFIKDYNVVFILITLHWKHRQNGCIPAQTEDRDITRISTGRIINMTEIEFNKVSILPQDHV